MNFTRTTFTYNTEDLLFAVGGEKTYKEYIFGSDQPCKKPWSLRCILFFIYDLLLTF